MKDQTLFEQVLDQFRQATDEIKTARKRPHPQAGQIIILPKSGDKYRVGERGNLIKVG